MEEAGKEGIDLSKVEMHSVQREELRGRSAYFDRSSGTIHIFLARDIYRGEDGTDDKFIRANIRLELRKAVKDYINVEVYNDELLEEDVYNLSKAGNMRSLLNLTGTWTYTDQDKARYRRSIVGRLRKEYSARLKSGAM